MMVLAIGLRHLLEDVYFLERTTQDLYTRPGTHRLAEAATNVLHFAKRALYREMENQKMKEVDFHETQL